MNATDVVRSDLAWLAKTFAGGTRDRDELRRASPVLRRLALDGVLQQARRQAGASGQPTLDIYPLSQLVDLTDLRGVELVVAAGCRIEQRLLGPFATGPSVAPMPTPMSVSSLPLPMFLKSPCLVVRGTAVTRAQVLKYVANKLGGVHFDPARGRPGDEYMARVEELDEFMIIRPLSAVDLSLLAVLQAFVASPSVMEPFGLAPVDVQLDAPLNSGHESVDIPNRAWLQLDLMGDHSPTSAPST
ncbi:hypothetical protein [Nocardioides lijunqiniae]|uniref:hypothetical protein n=1 Tax=Nocardioides lijunqiniae TaxID=2760832 RepID=UPI001878DCD4|nr:hypothetical protein [Nocardioides lijunqiniae]